MRLRAPFGPSEAAKTAEVRRQFMERTRLRERGFNMVEIAIALAVIAFALVAIVGVLPSGMQVQRETREKTIINQEAQYFLQAIKTGAVGAEDLPGFVEEIFTNGPPSLKYGDFVEGWEVIGLLSSTNHPTRAIVRALTGSAIDRSTNAHELAFRYQMIVEIQPATNTIHPDRLQDPELRSIVESNLWDLRLQFQWPVTPAGVGSGRAVYRGFVSAPLVNYPTGSVYHFFRP